MNESNQPTAWAVAVKGTYASMNNTDLTADLCLSQILNTELGIIHIRPLNEKWSLIASLGGGVYTDRPNFPETVFWHRQAPFLFGVYALI
jgi:hypothetical protein